MSGDWFVVLMLSLGVVNTLMTLMALRDGEAALGVLLPAFAATWCFAWLVVR